MAMVTTAQDDSRPQKRPREEEADSSKAPITQDDLFWFDDGSIILISKQRVGFRVHRSVLAIHSDFFADMFKLAHPADNAEANMEQLELEDHSGEIKHLLHFIYTPGQYQLLAVIGNAAACDKIPLLKSPGAHSPPSASSVPEDSRSIHTFLAQSNAREDSHQMCFQCIQMAYESNVPEILPCALYITALAHSPLVLDSLLTTRNLSISADTRKDLAKGCANLTGLIFKTAWSTMAHPEFLDICASGENCLRARVQALQVNLEAGADAISAFTKPEPSGQVLVADEDADEIGEGYVCYECHQWWRTREIADYDVVWGKLPECFGLKPWATTADTIA